MHSIQLRIGPIGFRICSPWGGPVAQLRSLYRSFPHSTGFADYTVRLEPSRAWRRWLRPSLIIEGDFTLREAAPLPLSQGLLAAEMGMNIQVAFGERRYLLLHAAGVERGGRMILITGESGAGKSTLAAWLGEHGWRFMGDEFALIDPVTGLGWPFPRPVSLKNDSIDLLAALVDANRMGPLIEGTPKGSIRHLVPAADAIAAMGEAAVPALIVFPRFGVTEAVRPVPPSEAFVRLTQASTNYVAMGERGFSALTGLVEGMPSVALDYPDTVTAVRLIEKLWEAL